MKKNLLLIHLIFIMIIIIGKENALAQISFTNPDNSGAVHDFRVTIPGNTATAGNAGTPFPVSYKSATIDYNITIYRRNGFNDEGYIRICSGTLSNQTAHILTDDVAGARTTSTNNTANSAWSASSANISKHLLSGTFNSANITSSDAVLTAVFVYTINGAIADYSDPIIISGQPTPPPQSTRPLSDFIPCGQNMVICGDQCVPYNSTPSLIMGRILADQGRPTANREWQAYRATVVALNTTVFSAGTEYEWTQWQRSYDNNNWQDISNATERNYQPPACYQTTYYRRVSTHINSHGIDSRESSYTSNVVTITPQAPAPTPVHATYSACNAGGNVAIAVTGGENSYNWWVPYAGWGASNDGNNPYSTYYNQGSFITPNNQVYITIPANTNPGTYEIAVSANGACGPKSPDAIIYIEVTTSGGQIATPGAATVVKNGSGCNVVYNISIPPVTNATRYEASFNGLTLASNATTVGRVVFSFKFAPGSTAYQVQGSITAIGACNNTAPKSYTLTIPAVANGCNVVADPPTSLTIFPNPATEQLVMHSVGYDAVATFYDTQGTVRKTVNLKAQNDQTSVNIHDLPAGVYHLRIVSDGKKTFQKQIVVER